jgi:phosphate transport system ATP-binding protein
MICKDGICIVSDQPLICVKDLEVRYKQRIALNDISIGIDACSITALIGPSGCGKTSFLNCLNRLTDSVPDCQVKGSIHIAGTDVMSPKTNLIQLRRQVGMIFQKPNPFPFSIWKNLDLTLRQHGYRNNQIRSEKTEGALRAVGLWDEVKDHLHDSALSLSGGQQQRLCIARAIVLEPEVMLFDEPCSALDPISMRVVEELIHGLRHKFTIVIVTHNLAQARRIADATAVFWTRNGSGCLIEHGPTANIFASPQNQITAAYLSGEQG